MLVALLSACFTNPTRPPEESPSRPEVQRAAPMPSAVVDRRERRVVAIGDLHGDWKATVAVLELAGLVDATGSWSGGDTVFVQTGDTTDRGPDSKGVIDGLRALVEPAKQAGGQVVMLNGNHEVMNLQGDWRYVSPADVETFGGPDKRKEALSETGEYGKFLRGLPVVAQVGKTIFVHGGLTDTFAELGIEGVNTLARQHYDDAPGPLGHPVHGETGPTWYRGYIRDEESVVCPILTRALKQLGATRMVVGHTTQRDGVVRARCGGRVTVIDVGISAHYGGHLGAWELVGDDARVLTPDGVVDLVDPGGVARPVIAD